MSNNNQSKQIKESLDSLGVLGEMPDLDNQPTDFLRVFAKVILEDPQLSFDLLFATPREKSKVVRLIAEFAIKKALEQQARSSGGIVEAEKLKQECLVLYDKFPSQAKWDK